MGLAEAGERWCSACPAPAPHPAPSRPSSRLTEHKQIQGDSRVEKQGRQEDGQEDVRWADAKPQRHGVTERPHVGSKRRGLKRNGGEGRAGVGGGSGGPGRGRAGDGRARAPDPRPDTGQPSATPRLGRAARQQHKNLAESRLHAGGQHGRQHGHRPKQGGIPAGPGHCAKVVARHVVHAVPVRRIGTHVCRGGGSPGEGGGGPGGGGGGSPGRVRVPGHGQGVPRSRHGGGHRGRLDVRRVDRVGAAG